MSTRKTPRPGPLIWPIQPDEMAKLRLLYAGLKVSHTMPFEDFIKIPHCAGPLRRALQAREAAQAEQRLRLVKSAEEFELTP